MPLFVFKQQNINLMKTFLIFVILFAFCACGNKNSKQADKTNSPDSVKVVGNSSSVLREPFVVKFQKSEKNHFQDLKLSEIASDIEYIPLETQKECMIGRSYSVKLTSNYIFIKRSGGAVLLFKRDRKFLRQINKEGRGPGECVSFFFIPDEKRNCVYIYALYQHKIFKYDFEGNFITKFEDPFYNKSTGRAESFGINSNNGNLYITYGNEFGDSKYKLAILDKDSGSLIKSFRNYDIYKTDKKPRSFAVSLGKVSIYNLDSKDYYKADFNDTIFSISDEGLKPHIILDLGRDKWTLKDNIELNCGVAKYPDVMNKTLIWGFYETTNKLFLKYNAQTSSFLGIFDKTSNEFNQNYDIQNIKNDIDGGIPFDLRRPMGPGNEAVYPVTIIDLKKQYSKSHLELNKALYPDKNEKFMAMLNALDDNDNPVIIIAKLK